MRESGMMVVLGLKLYSYVRRAVAVRPHCVGSSLERPWRRRGSRTGHAVDHIPMPGLLHCSTVHTYTAYWYSEVGSRVTAIGCSIIRRATTSLAAAGRCGVSEGSLSSFKSIT